MRGICRPQEVLKRVKKNRSFVIKLILFRVLSPRILRGVRIPRLVASPPVDGSWNKDPTLTFSILGEYRRLNEILRLLAVEEWLWSRLYRENDRVELPASHLEEGSYHRAVQIRCRRSLRRERLQRALQPG